MYTGNTFNFLLTIAIESVYPCVYREHNEPQCKHANATGLSLCIQGTQRDYKIYYRIKRFIPVYTGNTQSGLEFDGRYAVYPCVYREHLAKKITRT